MRRGALPAPGGLRPGWAPAASARPAGETRGLLRPLPAGRHASFETEAVAFRPRVGSGATEGRFGDAGRTQALQRSYVSDCVYSSALQQTLVFPLRLRGVASANVFCLRLLRSSVLNGSHLSLGAYESGPGSRWPGRCCAAAPNRSLPPDPLFTGIRWFPEADGFWGRLGCAAPVLATHLGLPGRCPADPGAYSVPAASSLPRESSRPARRDPQNRGACLRAALYGSGGAKASRLSFAWCWA